MHEAYTLRGSLRECHMNGPAPAAPVPAAAGILVTAPAPEQSEQPEQFLVTPLFTNIKVLTAEPVSLYNYRY